MKKRKNIIISAITCMFSICLMIFGVYAASSPSVSLSGHVSYSVHDAKVMVQGKINGATEIQTTTDYKQPANINDLKASDKLSTQSQFLNFTTGASLENDANDDLGVWNFGNLNFYEDQDGIKTIKISLLVTNLSNYPVKATLTYTDSYDNVTVTANKTQAYLAKYDQSKNADTNKSILTCDDFVVTLKVVDDSKNATANNFSMNIKIEKYVDAQPTNDKLTFSYNKDLYSTYGSYGIIGETSPQGLDKYYVAEIKQDASGEVVIPATYNDGTHGELPVVPGRVNGLATAIQAMSAGKSNEEAIMAVAIPQVTKVTLNTGITEVQNVAFAVMPSLAEVQIPSSLMYHQGGTFGASSALTTVSLPYGTKDLKTCPVGTTEMGMFWSCKALESFWMPDTVQTAGDYVFSLCSNLKKVHLSENLQAISKSMFYANNLTSIEIPEKVTKINDFGFFQNKSLVLSIIPENVTTIGKSAFRECEAITTIKMSNDVTSIGNSAFQDCKSLKTAVLSENITALSDNVFYRCIELTSIIIPSKVKTIGECAFSGCVSLIAFEMPESVVSIGRGAFYDCNALKNFDNLYNGAYYLGNASNPYILLLSAKDKNITSCQINQNTKFIHDYAFSDCTNLMSIEIPNSVTILGIGAFSDCTALTTVTILAEIPSTYGNIFTGSNNLSTIYVPSQSVNAYKTCWSDYADIIVGIG